MTIPIFTTFILIRVLIDYTLIERYNIDLKGIYKAITATITIVVCYLLSNDNLLIFGTLLLNYGLIFDTLLNILRKKQYNYLGSGFVDTIYSKLPYQFQIRLIIITSLNIYLLCKS